MSAQPLVIEFDDAPLHAPVPKLAYSFARGKGVLVAEHEGGPCLMLREGADPRGLIEARRAIGVPCHVQRLSAAAFDRLLSETYAGDVMVTAAHDDLPVDGLEGFLGDMPTAADLLDTQDDAPVIRLINGLIAEAVRSGASDIHIEPFESTLSIRLRIDGVLRETLSLHSRLAPVLVSRIKVMARLDIAEKRIPQDGRIPLALGGKTLDVRVSTLPSRAGERVVLRILDKEQADLSLQALGMRPEMLAAYQRALSEPNGIILVTGPTGSGKTTTLYAGLATLNDASRNILTIEDPVEYAVEGVGQTQVNTRVGMTFATGLRAILRQDPDVVMVGEIRDSETASIAVQASLTGHLVLSTVHTNDAAGAVTRLRDMGIEPFLLASTLRLIMAQRLVRRVCTACAEEVTVDAAQAGLSGLRTGTRIRRAVGCDACRNTGYSGRIGIYEAIRVTDEVRRLIASGAPEDQYQPHLSEAGGLAVSARALIAAGQTTIEEVLRVTAHGGGDDHASV
ncbi:MAG: type II secretion system ATPase GspE [Brevundimonas sp.]|uniref:type II secretion system ATPase GspE n=1 Tax=Brevundimonas sp. TaxID=1871086 RepID=UPI00391B1F9F